MTLYYLIIIFGISGNLYVIYSLVSAKAIQKRSQNSYLLSLAMADFLFCSVYSPYILSSLIDPQTTTKYETSCKIMPFLNYYLSVVGIIAITALSLDRYFAIRYPFRYQRHANTRVIYLVNLFIYLYPLACFCPLIVAKEWVKCYRKPGDPSGMNWRMLPLTYICLLAFLAFMRLV